MGTTMGLGQAAGVAAALAVKRGVTPRRLGASAVRGSLADMGVDL